MPKEQSSLSVTMPSEREIVMVRVFNAPRQLVFDAWTKPEHIARWLGRIGDTMTVCEVDLRVGGAYRFVWRLREGGEMGVRGWYREVVPSERLVSIETFEGPYTEQMGGETLNVLTFQERDGKTTVTLTVVYNSREDRDRALQTNMEQGVAESFDRLAELLETMTSAEMPSTRATEFTSGHNTPRETIVKQKIVPHLWFDKEAREAAEFYTSIFPNSRVTSVTTLRDTPSGDCDVVSFELAGQPFMAISAGPLFRFNESISFMVYCQTQEEIDYYWEKLSAVPEAEQCGWLKDKYGLSWQVVPVRLDELLEGATEEQAARVTQAFLQMKKLDIAELERAHAGR